MYEVGATNNDLVEKNIDSANRPNEEEHASFNVCSINKKGNKVDLHGARITFCITSSVRLACVEVSNRCKHRVKSRNSSTNRSF